jgi:hypothetical protein
MGGFLVTVLALPGGADLVEVTITDPPPTVEPGMKFVVTDTVRNQGGTTARRSETGYYLGLQPQREASDILLTGARSVPSLGPGESSTGSTTVTVPPSTPWGTYFLIGCADNQQVVGGSDEAQNCRTSGALVVVSKTIDLTGSWASIEHSCAGPYAKGLRCRLDGTFELRNIGASKAVSSQIAFYLSMDATFSADDLLLNQVSTPALDPGESVSKNLGVQLPDDVTAFGKFVIAVVDSVDRNDEVNEMNNHLSTQAAAALVDRVCSPEPTTNMPIAYGQRITCRIDSGADTDSFQFAGQAGDRVLIHARTLVGPGGPCIRLLAPTGRPLGQEVCASAGASIERTLQGSGTYTIVVHENANNEVIDYLMILVKNP